MAVDPATLGNCLPVHLAGNSLTQGSEAQAQEQMKVKLLQSYVMDLSDQNEVLVQAMEELEREAAWKVTTLEAELQRPSLAQRPVPTEHLSGSTATQTTNSSSGRGMEQEDLGAQVASKGQLIHQLSVQRREAARSQEEARAEVLEKEAKIQELQQIITGLHQEISLKDLEAASEMQEKHLLETKIQSLQQMVSSALAPCCPESQLSCSQASELLKAELERRDAKIRSLQSQLLLQQDKGDGLAAELDAQEQRIYQLQTKQRERQAELEQKHSQIQQLEQDVEASRRLQDESQRQLAECNVRLAQVEGENEALRAHQREQLLEVEDWVASLRSSERARECLSREAAVCEREEQAAEQALLRQRAAGLQDELRKKEAAMHRLQTELQDASRLGLHSQIGRCQPCCPRKGSLCLTASKVQEAKAQLAGAEAEVVSTRSKCSAALREAAESSAALQGLQQRTAEQEATIHQLERLARARLDERQQAAEQVRSRGQIVATLRRRLGAAEEELARAEGEGQTRALLLEQLQAELRLSRESRQAELQGLRQELDACKGQQKEAQGQLRQQEAVMAAQGRDLEHQLQQCRGLQEEVRERDDTIASLRSERLAVRSRAQEAMERLRQELQATQEDLARSRQQAQQCEDKAQGLREQLAASHSQVAAGAAALRDAQSEFASYAAAHSHSDASYDRLALQATALQQRLLELEVESTVHQQRAEEAERLARDWELQLERAAEQKHSTKRGHATA
ncbi:zinc finger homeobox protein 4 isoform F [Alligator mississippiensis]|uniref:Zinc finger homeobox protein 4 isoform F n=1 Tax=Alligator mississippiensis TaxID=8496 RepID=A0A151NNU9_ALLMI|nr:zinc finger homeobox protein 4 isoform F [Alligator mississippiensis]